jgi:hypothetical protein
MKQRTVALFVKMFQTKAEEQRLCSSGGSESKSQESKMKEQSFL